MTGSLAGKRVRGRGMAPTTEDTMAEAQPQEPNVTKEKKKKAGMKKKESDIDYEALEKQIASIKTNAVGSSAEKLLSQTLEELLALEKTYRLQADLKATSMCGVAVVQAATRREVERRRGRRRGGETRAEDEGEGG